MSEFDAPAETAAGMRGLPRRMGQPGAAIRLAAAGPAGQPGSGGDTAGLSRNPHLPNPFMMPLLSLAVIEDLDEVRRMPAAQRAVEAAKAADVLAGGFDFIARDERPRGGRAGRDTFHSVWRAMVRGIAIASLQPGGVTVLGQHFDATMWPYSGAEGDHCHGRIHSRRSEAQPNGWWLSRIAGTDPLTVPLLVDRESRWVYLTADGRWSDSPPGTG